MVALEKSRFERVSDFGSGGPKFDFLAVFGDSGVGARDRFLEIKNVKKVTKNDKNGAM